MEKKDIKNKDFSWQSGLKVFSEVSAWIAFPIIFALLLGQNLDSRYNTKPVLFLICSFLGFVLTSYGIVKSIKQYIKKENSEKNDK